MNTNGVSFAKDPLLPDVFNTLLDAVSEIVVIYEVHRGDTFHVIAMNSAATNANEISLDMQSLTERIVDFTHCEWLYAAYHCALSAQETYTCCREFQQKDDKVIVRVAVTPVIRNNLCTHVVLIAQDFTTMKQREKKLVSMAFHDSLTGTYNRAFFEDRLGNAIQFHQRHHYKFSLALLDCDEFKTINDTLGHQVGDAVLIQLSARIQSIIRTNDTIGRIGGDEFALLFDGCTANECIPILERLRHTVCQPWTIDGHTLQLSCSIGITDCTQGNSSLALLRQADNALYRAKYLGKGQYFIHGT